VIGHEHEQMLAVAGDAATQLLRRLAASRQHQHPVE
jgi:hypothetical protein